MAKRQKYIVQSKSRDVCDRQRWHRSLAVHGIYDSPEDANRAIALEGSAVATYRVRPLTRRKKGGKA